MRENEAVELIDLAQLWRTENMDLELMFEGWGITNSSSAMMIIRHNHIENLSLLRTLDRKLHQIYPASAIPNVLRRSASFLGMSMLQYMHKHKNGAACILDKIKTLEN